jgi:hypothetical protein
MAAINHPFPQARRGAPLPFGAGRINWWVLGAFAVFGVGALLPVLQNSTATTRGFDVQRLEAQQALVAAEIRALEADVAALQSLSRIEQRARELGLVPGTDPVYITVDVPGPAPARIPSEYLPRPTASGDGPAPWWQSLIGRLLPGN